MVKVFGALVLAALVVPTTAVRFEKDGVRVGDALVQGPALELKQIETGVLLASGTVVEPLSSEVAVEIASGRTLVLEPGVRAARSDKGYALTTHAGRKLLVAADGKTYAFGSSEALVLTKEGWTIGGEVLAAGTVRVSLQQEQPKPEAKPQGDPDSDLEAMRRAASRIQSRRRSRRSSVTVKMRRVFPTDPTVASEAADGTTLRSLLQVSPVGF